MLCSMCVTHEVKYDDLYNKLLWICHNNVNQKFGNVLLGWISCLAKV
jgi:hypothetical protein